MKKSVEVAMPSDREFSVTRVFDAPARLVFEYHSVPEKIRKWMLGPDGWSMPVCELEFRVGGTYRYLWRNDAGEGEFGARGVFKEIVVPSRIVHTEWMEGIGPEPTPEALCTLTFEEKDGRTTLTTLMLFPDKETRDGAMASGMADGMGASYDRMEAAMDEQAAA